MPSRLFVVMSIVTSRDVSDQLPSEPIQRASAAAKAFAERDGGRLAGGCQPHWRAAFHLVLYGATGLLCEPGDAAGLARNLEMLLAMPLCATAWGVRTWEQLALRACVAGRKRYKPEAQATEKCVPSLALRAWMRGASCARCDSAAG